MTKKGSDKGQAAGEPQGTPGLAARAFMGRTPNTARAEVLAGVSASLAESGLDYQTLLDIVARRSAELLGGFCTLRLIAADGVHLDLVAHYHTDAAVRARVVALLQQTPQRIDEGITALVLQTGQPLIVPPLSPEQIMGLINPAYAPEYIRAGISSMILAPIFAGGRLLGVLAVSQDASGPIYDESDALFLHELAGRAALALEYSRLLQGEQRARQRAEILQGANLALSQTLDRDVILDRLLDFLAELAPFDSANTMLLDRQQILHLRSLRGYEKFTDPELVRNITFDPALHPHLAHMIATQTSLVVADTRQLASWYVVPGSEHIRSWMGVPLVAGGRVVGIYALDKTEPNYFTAEHQRAAEALAAQAAVAIENAELYEAELLARQHAEILSAAGVALTREHTIDSVLTTLLDYLGHIVPYDSAGCMLIDSDEVAHMQSVRGYERWSDVALARAIKLDARTNLIMARLMASKRSILVPNTRVEPGWEQQAGAEHVLSWMGVPLIVGDKVVGLYSVDKAEPNFFTGEHLRLAEGLAAHAAVAVENARLYSETQVALRHNEAMAGHLNSLLQATNAGFYGIDETARCTFINRAGAELLGYRPEELIGRELHPLIHHTRADGTAYPLAECPIVNSALTGIPCRVDDDSYWRKDGTSFAVGYSSQPIIVNSQPRGAVVTFADVTELKQAQEARRAREAAEAASHAKSEFLSRMSHELRTPLNSILGFAQILQSEELDAERNEYLSYILQGGQHLLGLINEVLDMSRIESGRLVLAAEVLPVEEVLQESLDLVSPLAAERDLQMAVDFEQFRGLNVYVDRQRLRQVLLNLLSNAVKYNVDHGNIRISCSVRAALSGDERQPGAIGLLDGTAAAGGQLRRLRILVADSGPGIDPQQLPRLFTPFERLGAELSEIEGTGLGLVLSKLLMEAMGGIIGVENHPGQGATFWVELPALLQATRPDALRADTPGSAQQPANPDAELPRRNVVYIEDNVFNRKLVQRILSTRSHVSLTTFSSAVGLALADLAGTDLLLLDLNLPGVTGEEFLKLMKGAVATRNIPVVIISADATPEQVHNLLAAGATAYLTKPIDVEKFLQVIDGILSRAGS